MSNLISKIEQKEFKAFFTGSLTEMNHGSLSGLLNDDHTQYLLTNGNRELSGDWDTGSTYKILTRTIKSNNTLLDIHNDNNEGIRISNVGGAARIGIATTTLTAALNLGGDRVIRFQGGGGTISAGSDTMQITAANRLTISSNNIRIGGDVGAARLSVLGTGSSLPVAVRQASGGNSILISLRDSSNNENLQFGADGTISNNDGSNGVYRFPFQHIVTPASATDDGVGLSLRTENKNGSMTDIGYIDFRYSDILNDQCNFRLYVRRTASLFDKIEFDGADLILTKADTSTKTFAYTDHIHTVVNSRTWAIEGSVAVKSFIGTIVKVPAGHIIKLDSADYKIGSGTSVTLKVTINGVDAAGFTGISITTTVGETDPTGITLNNNDLITIESTAISGSPTDMTVTLNFTDEFST